MVSDEMVEKALEAIPEWASARREHKPAWRRKMRAALDAIAPAIRAEALEEAAVAMDDWPCRAAAIRAMKEKECL